ncbi:helix-turn-helix transcriptional regulator [Streptomyces sp. NBC_01443]|uniref:helix-turn-helix domain-containing protein n=1 Tax=Streptomyces sp. NBC_01443 TaxID=2903868 RepID=UPI00225245DF|nr:helix-turn-helix transcriptional regulator [Streptomyces sp. NBC_01443]MCX4628960.1 helix-turn-helix domain-containing protein [Streptomyces sp. NBC_01443]
MGVDSDGTEEHSWAVDPEDEQGAAVVAALGRQMRARREALGMRVGDLAAAIQYGEALIYKVEGGKRIAKPEYLDKVDDALKAGGLIRAMAEDLSRVRYPKKVRKLAKMESEAVELLSYGNHNLHGLLQTEQYARSLFEMWHPVQTEEEVERGVAGRMDRHSIFERSPAPALSFVLEAVTLQRPIGGKMVMRGQLERLLEIGKLRHVSLQVMPTASEKHAGMGGVIQVLKFDDGSAVGRCEGMFNGRPVSDPKRLRVLDHCYGMIRSQALPPPESMAYIEHLLGET